jgi:hypothetical protein
MNVIDDYLRWLLDYLQSPDGLQKELREIFKACKAVGLEDHAVYAVCYYIQLVHDKHKAIIGQIENAQSHHSI